MPDPLKIVFGVLSTYERNGWHHPSITQFFADLPFQTGYGFRMVPIHNFSPAASGRNVFCKNFKYSDADWICMIDNDMAIPANLLDALKDVPPDAGIVVPTFYLWDQSKFKVVLCWGMDTAQPDGVKTFGPGYHELTKCGTGVIFIRPSVLQQIPYPYFTYLYNSDQGMDGTEDIQFCIRARQAGIKIYGNANVTVGHYHSVELASMWKWAENVYKLDNKTATRPHSEPKDAESPSVPQVTSASPANVT
jgi:hypothetical protein